MKHKRRLFLILLISCLLVSTISFFVPQVFSADILIDGDLTFSSSFAITVVDPSSSGAFSAYSQSFLQSHSGSYRITNASFQLSKVGSPVGNLTARLYSATGTFGSTMIPNTFLRESNKLAMSTLPASPGATIFNFTFTNSYIMVESQYYCIVVAAKEATLLDASNRVIVAVLSPGLAAGNAGGFSNGVWTPSSGDLTFAVYGSLMVEGLYESYTTPGNDGGSIGGAVWRAQTFTTSTTAHNVSTVWLKMYRYLYPGTLSVSLQAVDGFGAPDGTDIWLDGRNASQFTPTPPGVWYDFIDLPPTALLASTQYAIVCRATAGGPSAAIWRLNKPGTYAGGHSWSSNDNGVTWLTDAADTWDYMFEIWGDDVLSPTYSNISHSSTIAGSSCTFSSNWIDNGDLDKGIFSTNNTGGWVNDTIYTFTSNPAWYNVTKTLSITVGQVVGYRWYVNDTANNLNDTGIFTLTITPSILTYDVYAPSSTDAGDTCLFTSYWQDSVGLSGYIFSTNNTGAWVNDTWTAMTGTGDWANATHVLNSTIGVEVSYRWYTNNTGAIWETTPTYNFITTDPALTHPIVPPWSIPYYVPLLGKGIALITCFGACALIFASVKNMKEALKGAVLILLIGIIFLIIWFIMTSLEAYA